MYSHKRSFGSSVSVLWPNLFLVIALTVGLSSPAHSQAFGIEMGSKPPDVDIKRELNPGTYYIIPPVTHPEFDTYFVEYTDEFGVCGVKAFGKVHDSDASRRNAYNELKTVLSNKYGSSSDEETSAVWKRQYDSSLPKDIHQIFLTIVSTGEPFIVLEYEFRNQIKCHNIIHSKKKDAL
jgi:hypothetical protein